RESELRPELEHARIVAQHFASQATRAALTAVADELPEEQPAQAVPFEIRAHHYREFRLDVVRIGRYSCDAECLAAARLVRVFGNQRHLTVVVDLGQAGDVGIRQLAESGQEARVQILRRTAREKALVLSK